MPDDALRWLDAVGVLLDVEEEAYSVRVLILDAVRVTLLTSFPFSRTTGKGWDTFDQLREQRVCEQDGLLTVRVQKHRFSDLRAQRATNLAYIFGAVSVALLVYVDLAVPLLDFGDVGLESPFCDEQEDGLQNLACSVHFLAQLDEPACCPVLFPVRFLAGHAAEEGFEDCAVDLFVVAAALAVG